MTNPINYQNQTIPAYSGITINITNPTLNPPAMNHICPPNCPAHNLQPQNIAIEQAQTPTANRLNSPAQYGVTQPNQGLNNYPIAEQNSVQNSSQAQGIEKVSDTTTNTETIKSQNGTTNPQEGIPQAYPPQYYLNNYNYIQNGEKGNSQANNANPPITNMPQGLQTQQAGNTATGTSDIQEEDMTSSKEIIDGLNARVAEEKELEKNGKQTKVVALTNEYIMSLENYLNNPNTEIRLMAAKEILTRLDEDKNRYDDAALNALLNKMLQDPEKLVRIAALSAFSSQLASGNDYTIQLLTKIQNNPNADKEDVLQAADSLLKMSSRTEIRYTPQKIQVVQPQAEQQ